MFEGQEKCALCNVGIVHSDAIKRTDVDGVTHAFCAQCAQKKGDVGRWLKLRH
ncbi:MAG: hypothetical protein PHQ80_04230 [Candidatus ainarchaeum sp.]|nr:hypothetical protein [Candidatus ainarchaeum sp.]MDD5096643.1 hypothetical protein [Candidatus ainarchaeum sp.]